MTTAATSGVVTIDIYELWLYHFARMWRDIGLLAGTPIIKRHIKKITWLDHVCDCFACRVEAAAEAAGL